MLQEAQLAKMEAETAQIEASFKPIVRPEVQQTGGNPPPAAAEIEEQPETTVDVRPAEATEEPDLARLAIGASEHFLPCLQRRDHLLEAGRSSVAGMRQLQQMRATTWARNQKMT